MKAMIIRYTPKLFALLMVVNGLVDLYRPAFIVEAMESLNMPLYLLWILGVAKLLGGITILLDWNERLTEWAFAGFFIWAFGGISSHVLSGHNLNRTVPIFVLTAFLMVSFYCYDQVPTDDQVSSV